ncbi:hypothetical protein F4779DRAFT_632590 [Xylariaceae sp. FL0662B]|nr:hypothetical protein F4779DRAFT_632590 [Xylariaceae sp. FL0662B]
MPSEVNHPVNSVGGVSELPMATGTVTDDRPSDEQPHNSPNDNDGQPIAGQRSSRYNITTTNLPRTLKALWGTLRSTSDKRMIVRFLVVIFNLLAGIAVIYSTKVAPARSDITLPSPEDDSYPIMVAQVAGSLLSPLLFAVVSAKDSSSPLRRKLMACYFLLLVLGVIMSVVTLLVYVLWPSRYRIANMTTIASLEFTVLGGWLFLEKCWKEANEAPSADDNVEMEGV